MRAVGLEQSRAGVPAMRIFSHLCFVFTAVEPVFDNTNPHVITPEPDRTPASERRIAGREYDLLVGAHAHNLVRQDQGAPVKLL